MIVASGALFIFPVLFTPDASGTTTDAHFSLNGLMQCRWELVTLKNSPSTEEWKIERARLGAIFGYGSLIEINITTNLLSESLLRNAYLGIYLSPELRLIAGQFRMPFSREMLTPSSGLLVLDRGKTNDEFTDNYYQGWDIGAAIEWVPLPGRIGFTAGVFQGDGMNEWKDNNGGKAVAGRILVSPFMGFEAGAAGIYNPVSVHPLNPRAAVGKHAFELDYDYVRGQWKLQGEYRTGDNWMRGNGISMFGVQQYILYSVPLRSWILQRIEPGIKIEYFDLSRSEDATEYIYIVPCVNLNCARRIRMQANIVFERPRASAESSRACFTAQIQMMM